MAAGGKLPEPGEQVFECYGGCSYAYGKEILRNNPFVLSAPGVTNL